ncbi:hypothetical protein K8R62_00800, partial [bacterium]|nr:hypothetical protein [bacterium]
LFQALRLFFFNKAKKRRGKMEKNFWCTICNTPGLEIKYDEKTGDEIMVCVNCKSHFSKNPIDGFLNVIDNATHLVLCDKPPILGFA